MIPAAGRDVQCSNCMKTWFQSGPTQAAPETEEDLRIDDKPAPPPPPPPAEMAAPKPVERVPAPPPPPESDDYEDDPDTSVPSAAAALASSRRSAKIDPEALAVIEEEVNRERSARRAEAENLETQIDLGIDDSEIEDRAAAARKRMARQRGTVEVEDEIADVDVTTDTIAEDVKQAIAAEPAAKRELLPDIEEINSTLADAPEHDDFDDSDADIIAQRHPKTIARRGFRLGFGLMLLIAACFVGLYVYAPIIAAKVPSMMGFLEGYVSVLDGIRVWLDRSAQDLVEQITKLIGNVNA